MRFSGTRSFIHTRNSIIEAALRKIGIITQGEMPTNIQYQEATNALNSMVQSWQSKGVFLWSLLDEQLNLVKGTRSYTIPNALEIQYPVIVRDDIRKPLTILTKEEYEHLEDRLLESMPTSIYVFYGLENITIFVYPVPDRYGYVLSYVQLQRLQDFVSGNNMPDFPIYWSDALIYGLAHRLSAEYSIPLQERQLLLNESIVLFNDALSNSREKGNIQFGVKR